MSACRLSMRMCLGLRAASAAPGPARPARASGTLNVCFDGGRQAAPRGELAAHHAPLGPSGLHDVAQDTVHSVLIENTEVSIGQKISLKGLQLEAQLSGTVLDGDGAVVGQTGFRAHRAVFREARGDLVPRELVGPGLQPRKLGADAGAGVLGRVVRHGITSPPFYTGTQVAAQRAGGRRAASAGQGEADAVA